MKIVCDTNVLIAGILFSGNSREILRMASQGIVRNFISPDILREAQDVLLRPKFALTHEQVNGILQLFRDSFHLVFPTQTFAVVKSDPDDDRILEAAQSANVKTIVSGDHHLLDLKEWKSIRIMSPAQFIEEIRANNPLVRKG